MDISQHLKNVKELGYSTIENIISAGVLTEVQRKFENLAERYESEFDASRISEADRGIIRCLLNRDSCFEVFFYLEEVVAVAKAILGDFIHYSFNGIYTSKNYKHPASVFHRDLPGDLWTIPDLSITNFYLIDDTTEENGATWLVPGSHLMEVPPSPEYIEKHKIQATGKAGSVIITQSKLYHASGVNYSGSPRKIISNVMRRSFIKPQFNWKKVLTDDAIGRMNEETKRLFDFYTSPPNSPEEYYAEGVRRREAKARLEQNKLDM